MKQKDKVLKLHGEIGFNSYYEQIFGSRWNVLKECLKKDVVHAKLSFDSDKPYFLDSASICAALCLPVHKCEKVLDLCAAPGGKTLVLAGNLDKPSYLFSNERSPERKARLVNVIQQVLPQDISSRVVASCSDGSTWCRRETESFDSILLDAPCSSERHVLCDNKYLSTWSPSRVKSLSVEQWALLSSAWRLLKTNGFLLYATCALAPAENDDVLFRLQKKFSNAKFISFEEMKQNALLNYKSFLGTISLPNELSIETLFNCAERTKFGVQLLPDTAYGTGPLFFCLLQKVDTDEAVSKV